MIETNIFKLDSDQLVEPRPARRKAKVKTVKNLRVHEFIVIFTAGLKSRMLCKLSSNKIAEMIARLEELKSHGVVHHYSSSSVGVISCPHCVVEWLNQGVTQAEDKRIRSA